jgi:hypothetical protein
VPALSDARIQSHREVTAAMHQGLQMLYPSAPVDPLEIAVRLSVELMYAAIETLFDDPELEPMRVGASHRLVGIRHVCTCWRDCRQEQPRLAGLHITHNRTGIPRCAMRCLACATVYSP